MASFTVGISGTSGYQLIMSVDQSSQDVGANTSYDNIVLYVHQTAGSGIWGSGSWSANVNGTAYGAGFGYDYRSVDDVVVLDTYLTVAHAQDGTKTTAFSGAVDMQNSPYATTGNSSGTLTQTTINRYAAISVFTVTPITDVGFTINVTTDVTCDLLEYSIDNGSNYTSVSGEFTTKSQAVVGLISGTLYPVKVRVRRKDSQLKTTSSVVNATTLVQNNFFDLGF